MKTQMKTQMKTGNLNQIYFVCGIVSVSVGALLLTPSSSFAESIGGQVNSPVNVVKDNQTRHSREAAHGKTEKKHSDRIPASTSTSPRENNQQMIAEDRSAGATQGGADQMVPPAESNAETVSKSPKDPTLPRDSKGIVGATTANHATTMSTSGKRAHGVYSDKKHAKQHGDPKAAPNE